MRNDIRTVLMTGAGGFMGRHLAPALSAAFPNASRVAIVRSAYARRLDGWIQLEADITDAHAIERIFCEFAPEVIIHLAAYSVVSHAAGAAVGTWKANAFGPLVLASAIAKHAPNTTVLFASSGEVYGDSFKRGPANEATPLLPKNAYSASKAAAELIFQTVLPSDTRLIVARAFNHTGPGHDERFVLPSFAAQIARIEAGLAPPRLLTGNLDARRDFLDVDDVVRAYIDLLTADNLPSRLVVNVASGQALRIGSLLARMRARARRHFDHAVDPDRIRPSDIPCALGDPTLLNHLTGWKPERSIDDLLESLLNHWRAEVGNNEACAVTTIA